MIKGSIQEEDTTIKSIYAPNIEAPQYIRQMLKSMKVKSESEVAQSCPTLSDPLACSPPGSSIPGIFQARVLEWGAIAFSTLLLSTYYILLSI